VVGHLGERNCVCGGRIEHRVNKFTPLSEYDSYGVGLTPENHRRDCLRLEIFAVIDALIFVGIAVFQVLLAAGKPSGEYTWGGANAGVLPASLRRGSAVSATVFIVAAFIVLIEGGVFASQLRSGVTIGAVWILAVLLLVGTVMNGISRSSKERNLWTPVTALVSVMTFVIAIGD